MKPTLLLTSLFFAGCLPAFAQLPVAELKREKPINFATEVYPFLKANCLACHNSTKAKADLILESPQDMIRGGDSGPSIEPGNADNSFLFTTAAHIEEPTMPPANNKSKAENLTPEQLALLKRWIEEGAKGDVVSTAAPESWTFLTGPQPIYTAAVSDDGRFAVAGRGQKLDLYDLRLGKFVETFRDPSLPKAAAHRDLVQAVAFSPDGRIASGGYRTVKIWERSREEAGEALDLPSAPSSIAVTPDRSLAAIGNKDGSIVLMTKKDGKPAPVTVKDHKGEISGLAFSLDGKTLFSISADNTVKRRSVADPTKSISLALLAPATSLTVLNGGTHIVVGGQDHSIRIAHADLKTPMKPAISPPAPKETPKPTPAPEKKKTAAPKPAPAKEKPASQATKTEVKPAPKPAPKATPAVVFSQFKIHAHPVAAIERANATGTEFLVAHTDGTVIHFKIEPKNLLAVPAEVRRIAHGMPLNQLAASLSAPTGPRIATAGPTGPVKLWNLADGKIIAELKGDPNLDPKIEQIVRETTIANRLKSHWDKKIPEDEKLWKAESEKAKQSGDTIAKARRDLAAKRAALKELKAKLPAATEEELAKAKEGVTAGERTLTGAIRNRESAARLAGDAFARQTAAEAASLEAAALSTALKTEDEALRKAANEAVTNTASTALTFSADGEILLESLKAGGLRSWSTATGEWLEDTRTIGSTAFATSLSDDTLLAAGEDKTLIPWTLPGKTWRLAKSLGNGTDPKPFVDRVSALAFHPDGSMLLTGTGVPSRSGKIALWDTTTWATIVVNGEAHDDTITSFAFSPDGARFASAGTDQFVKLFDTATLAHEKTFEGHTSHVLDVDWNPDNLTLASSGADLQVKVWDLGEGQEKSKVEGFKKEVSSVAFVGPSDTLVTASGDKTLKLANAPLPEAGDTFLHTADVTPDGKVIIAGGQDSILRIWDAKTKKLVKAFASPDAEAGNVAEK